MKKILLVSALAVVSSALSFGAACGSPGSQYLSQLVALGATGCTIGNLTFSNFSNFSQTGTLGFNPLGTNQTQRITINPTGGNAGILFAYVTADLGTTGFDLTASAGQSIAISFEFDITSSAGPIVSMQGMGTFGNTTPGSFQFNKDAADPKLAPIGTATIADGGLANTFPTVLFSNTVPINLVSFHAKDTINLQGGGVSSGGSSTNRNFANILTPEPLSMGLVGLGLLALGLVGRRFKK